MNLTQVNGIPVNIMLSQQKIDELATLDLRSSDLFVVSYPKSGTTWTQKIVKLILSNGVDDGVLPFLTIPWLEADDFLRKFLGESPLDLKVHREHENSVCV